MNTMFENVSFIYMTEGEKWDKFKKGVSDAADATKRGAQSAWEGTKKGAKKTKDFFVNDWKEARMKHKAYNNMKTAKKAVGQEVSDIDKKTRNEAIKAYAKGGAKAAAAAGLTAAAIYAWYKKHKKNKGKKK